MTKHDIRTRLMRIFICWWNGPGCYWGAVNWKDGKPYTYCPECGKDSRD